MMNVKQSVPIFVIRKVFAMLLFVLVFAAVYGGITLHAKAAVTFPATNLSVVAGEEVYPKFKVSEGLMLYSYTIKDASKNVVVSQEYDYRSYSSPGNGNPFTITKAGTYTISWTVGGYSLVVVSGNYNCKPTYANTTTNSQTFTVTKPASSYSGTWGSNLSWILNRSTGVLTISGMGDMPDGTNVPWSKYYEEIKSVIIGNGVTRVGSENFWNHFYMTSVTISDSVTSIGNYAFYSCYRLTSVTIPGSVTAISNYAFYHCDSLTSVHITDLAAWCGISFGNYFSNPLYYAGKLYLNGTLLTEAIIPNGVTAISDYAFYYCDSLTSVTIPDSVTSIGEDAFSGCSIVNFNTYGNAKYLGNSSNPYVALMSAVDKTITSCTVHPNTKVIYYCAFSLCESLTSVTIPDSVTSIGNNAFSHCESLTSVTIPDSVTSIGDGAFYYCQKLTSVTIGNGVTSIGNDAFYHCDSLTSVTIPGSVTSIGDYAFGYCSSLTSVHITDLAAWCGIGFGDSYSNPLCYAGKLYLNGTLLTEVTIPAGVTAIPKYAFYSCDSLTSVTIPDSVTSIGNNAFHKCTSLTSIEVSGNNPAYSSQDGVLFNKDKTTLIQCPGRKSGVCAIPESVTAISDDAFYRCGSLTSITIPDSITSIQSGLLYGCGKLESLTIPFVGKSRKISSYDNRCPLGYIFGTSAYTGGTKVAQENGLDFIVYEDYYIPSSLRSVTVTGGKIAGGAFENCSMLTSVTIGDGVTSINATAFYNCDSLTNIDVTKNNTTFSSQDGVLFNKDKTTLIRCPEGKSGAYAIPDGVTSIGKYAFYSCSSLTSIAIPDSVTSIGNTAFYGCNSLARITYCGTSSQWNKISIGTGNDPLKNATRTYHTTHEWTLHTATTPATCTKAGFGEYSCICGVQKEDVIPALGHDWNSGRVTTAATCTTAGVKTITCRNDAAHTKTETIAAFGHSWDSGKVTTAATCTTAGVKTITCRNDATHTKTETIAALGHNLTHYAAKAATCTEDGWEEYESCSRCDYTTYAGIPVLGHDMLVLERVDPRWEAEGYEIAVCSRCNLSTNTVLPKLKLGDLSNDGVINTKDVTLLRRVIAGGYGIALVDKSVADANKDGVVNAKDVTILRRHVAGDYGVVIS